MDPELGLPPPWIEASVIKEIAEQKLEMALERLEIIERENLELKNDELTWFRTVVELHESRAECHDLKTRLESLNTCNRLIRRADNVPTLEQENLESITYDSATSEDSVPSSGSSVEREYVLVGIPGGASPSGSDVTWSPVSSYSQTWETSPDFDENSDSLFGEYSMESECFDGYHNEDDYNDDSYCDANS